MRPVKGYWVVLGLFGVMLLLWGTRYYLASSPAIPGPRFFQLTRATGRTLDPALSPDGRLVAFASDQAGNGVLDIWVRQVGGGESIQVTHGPGDKRQPAFSADGLRIAYAAADGGIDSVDLRGSPPVRMVATGRSPRFSPDGRWLAYAAGHSDLYVVPAAGGEARLAGHATALSWSSDSQSLLLSGDSWQITSWPAGARKDLPSNLKGVAIWARGYVYYCADDGIQRIPMTDDGRLMGPPERIQTGPGAVSSPAIAGSRLVYLKDGALWLTNPSSER